MRWAMGRRRPNGNVTTTTGTVGADRRRREDGSLSGSSVTGSMSSARACSTSAAFCLGGLASSGARGAPRCCDRPAVVQLGDDDPVVGLYEHQVGEQLLDRLGVEHDEPPDRTPIGFVDGHHLEHVAFAERRDRRGDEVVVEQRVGVAGRPSRAQPPCRPRRWCARPSLPASVPIRASWPPWPSGRIGETQFELRRQRIVAPLEVAAIGMLDRRQLERPRVGRSPPRPSTSSGLTRISAIVMLLRWRLDGDLTVDVEHRETDLGPRLVELGGVLAEQLAGLRPGREVDHRCRPVRGARRPRDRRRPVPKPAPCRRSRGPRHRLRGRRPAGGRATARTASVLPTRDRSARSGTDDRDGQGGDEDDSWDAAQRANVAVAQRSRRPIAATTAAASRRRRPSPRRPRRSGSGGRTGRASRANAASRRSSSSPLRRRASASSPRRPVARHGTIAAQRWSTTAATSSVTWVTSPTLPGVLGVERLAGEQGGGEVRRHDSAEDRHRDDRRDDTDADLGEGERHGAVDDDEVARRHQADTTRARRAGDGGDRRDAGVHQPLERPHDRSGVRRPAGPLLEIGAGTERRWRVGEHDGADVAGGDGLPRRRRGRCAGRRRARRDRALRLAGESRVIVATSVTSMWTSSSVGSRRSKSACADCDTCDGAQSAVISARKRSTSARSRVRRIGGRALTMSQR